MVDALLSRNRRDRRDRVTVDLRGTGPVLQQRAASQGLSVAALVRQAVVALAESPDVDATGPARVDRSGGGPLVKVTLRLPRVHAFLLTRWARRAEVSQGIYVASLLEGCPMQAAAPNHAEAISALSRSTDQLARLGSDLAAGLRGAGWGGDERLDPDRAGPLLARLREHLELASRLLAELQQATPVRRPPRARAAQS